MADYKKTIDFIKSVYGNQEFTPLAVPVFIGNEKKYLNECIDTTFVSSVGKFVDRFENDMAAYTGAKRAVVCVSGTNALHMALLLVGVKRDDEVLTQALTFIATENALSYIGAYPVFLDVDRSTMGLSPDALKEWLHKNAEVRKNTRIGELDKSYDFAYEEDELACYNKNTGRRIKACVPMHTFGHPCRIVDIRTICDEHNLMLIEDAAESVGSFYKGKHTGTFGKVSILSFNGNKTLTTGGGGMLLTDDEELAARAKYLSTTAKEPAKWGYYHKVAGWNLRMPGVNAAIGAAQLEYFDKIIENKRETAEMYKKFFAELNIPFVTETENSRANYWLNAILLKDREEREQFLEFTNSNGVQTRPIWTLMYKMPPYEKCEHGDMTNSEWLEDHLVNIPSSVRTSL